jgi:glycerol-3-phosphate dehydrogenase
MFDVAVIGAGVIGTFIARELSRYELNVALIEKDSDVANGTTKANSAIVHAGYDARPGTNKGKFNALGNPMFEKICGELDVPFKRIGSLVIASNEDEMETLKESYEQGIQNKIPNMEIIDKEKVKALEPNLNEEIIGALYAPTCGIVGPFELTIALAENAVENGVQLFLNSKVVSIEKQEGYYGIKDGDKEIKAKYVINCAGVYADKINNMVASPSFKIIPRRGQYFLLEKKAGSLVNRVIFQCPTKLGKGVLVTRTVHGNLIVGPNAENLDDNEDIQTTAMGLEEVRNASYKTSNKIPFNLVITSFSGLRATSTTGDFIIEESKEAENFINVAGIESPGLSAAPAIAEYVVGILNNKVNGLVKKQDFNPIRRKVIRFMELSDIEKAEVIKKDPRYGRIICRCESITEGEIVDAINRKVGATTLDGVKRRARPGMGICQGGFCGPRVIEILARELKIDELKVLKSNKDTNVLVGKTKEPNSKESSPLSEDYTINTTSKELQGGD